MSGVWTASNGCSIAETTTAMEGEWSSNV